VQFFVNMPPHKTSQPYTEWR